MKIDKELTEEQKIVVDVLTPFISYVFNAGIRNNRNKEVEKIIDNISIKYGLKTNKPTLRDYLKEHSKGAYHSFIFSIYNTHIEVTGVEDFEALYKAELLDKYKVIKDEMKDNQDYRGDNYRCEHYLELERIE